MLLSRFPYENGDYGTALKLWLPLAKQGDATAQFNFGVMYYNGRGVPQDYVQAHMWWNLAASRTSGESAKEYSDARAFLPMT